MEFEPKVFRTVVFVRHGQYSSNPEELTALGRKQAKQTAKALRGLKPSKLHCSTMPRAIETAAIIGQELGLKARANDIFREGLLPGTIAFNNFVTTGKTPAQVKEHFAKAKLAQKQADSAFSELFKAPVRGQNVEVVVAHGNVIRYWVCKALDIPEEKWLKMDVSHTSLTTIRVSKNGNIILLGFSDTGHLPLKLRTYV
ncbi:histidine phosphatase family protein [Bdellovibrio bacteriovorus]|uniref:histidine phosphatase family protein n=1 Tax=Bdellovibrio bacteriovorus TaxID=959 RepID=UPI0035A62CC4